MFNFSRCTLCGTRLYDKNISINKEKWLAWDKLSTSISQPQKTSFLFPTNENMRYKKPEKTDSDEEEVICTTKNPFKVKSLWSKKVIEPEDIEKSIHQWDAKQSLTLRQLQKWIHWSNFMSIGSITIWKYCIDPVWNNCSWKHFSSCKKLIGRDKLEINALLKNRPLNELMEIINCDTVDDRMKWKEHCNECELYWADWQLIIWEEWVWFAHKTHKKIMFEDKVQEELCQAKEAIREVEEAQKLLLKNKEEIEYIRNYHLNNFVSIYNEIIASI